MPSRPRSHQLEEESIDRFRDLLPRAWVYRLKTPDYGIDGEVEIFENDQTTGLGFLVQLRATDNPDRADRVELACESLDYYLRCDQPVGVARYCSATQSFYWQWAARIDGRVSRRADQKTVTYVYREEERWTKDTPQRIRRMVFTRRALATFPAGAALPVRLDLEQVPAGERYAVERAFVQAIADSDGTLRRCVNEREDLEVTIAPAPDYLSVRIDEVTSISFDLPAPDAAAYVHSALYGLARLLLVKKLARQAERIARLILARGVAHHHDGTAHAACMALAGDLPAMVELAIVNGLHTPESPLHGAIALTLSQAPQPAATRRAATETFFAASLEAARPYGADNLAAVHYSIGNFSKHDSGLVGLRHFNRARHLRPAYLKTDYFLAELAGLLFETHRFNASVRAYAAAREQDNSPRLAFLHGDALLLAGQLEEAHATLTGAAEALPSGSMLQEAELKAFSCGWLIETRGADPLPRHPMEAGTVWGAVGRNRGALEAIVSQLDGLHPGARFDLGVLCANADDRTAAAHHFLLCAYAAPWNTDAWSNAAICALGLGKQPWLTAILTVGINRAGSGMYDSLREKLVSQQAPDQLLQELDSAAMMILGEAEKPREDAFTLRILNGDSYETMMIAGSGEA